MRPQVCTWARFKTNSFLGNLKIEQRVSSIHSYLSASHTFTSCTRKSTKSLEPSLTEAESYLYIDHFFEPCFFLTI
ncbi:unnamed protein product [Brassica napus]|uniref:(rape) hypothetical protein n=1 Tax=Brassica napus TaxID=3708 RepID=A0A816UC74_BRANA|nr:unnamed protein product [Brassica napus]